MERLIAIAKFIGWSLIGLLAALLVFVAFSVKPLDRTSYREQDFYSEMNKNLASLDSLTIPTPIHGFTVGYGKENITPAYPTSMAGVGLRRLHFQNVRDSIFVRTIVISNGQQTVSLVSLDMLLVPPAVTRVLAEKLPSIGFTLDNTYLSATHTHSSIGNWGENLAGALYTGGYNDSLVHFLANQIIKSISAATANQLRSTLRSGTVPISGIVYNRLAREEGTVDSLMRAIEFERADGKKIMLATFTGHATCDQSSSLNISRDYPGELVDRIEQRGYSFAMFMAGAVGSHGCRGPEKGDQRINFIGDTLASALLRNADTFTEITDSVLTMVRVPLVLGKPQLKISTDWCIRPWLFKSVFGEYTTSITALRMGDLIMLGTPCDFSGELDGAIDSTAAQRSMKAMVTSFNGGYIGYITLDKHYDINHFETRLMNWYGPGNGAYLSECLMKIINATSK